MTSFCTTVTGLQELVDTANAYVNRHGLRFNPAKTSCMTIGRNRLSHTPTWTIDQTSLSIVDGITYLGQPSMMTKANLILPEGPVVPCVLSMASKVLGFTQKELSRRLPLISTLLASVPFSCMRARPSR